MYSVTVLYRCIILLFPSYSYSVIGLFYTYCSKEGHMSHILFSSCDSCVIDLLNDSNVIYKRTTVEGLAIQR